MKILFRTCCIWFFKQPFKIVLHGTKKGYTIVTSLRTFLVQYTAIFSKNAYQ